MRHACLKLPLVAAFSAACAFVPGGAAPALAAQACESANAMPASTSSQATVRATLCVLNAQRAGHGLRPLKLHRRLSSAARRHAQDMARRNFFAHETPGGGSFVDRIRSTGYLNGARRWTVGENLAWGTHGSSSPRVITQMWMNSPPHRANILNPSYREIGIGVVTDAPVPSRGGPAATYATDFGARR